jgi:hypothetical protein
MAPKMLTTHKFISATQFFFQEFAKFYVRGCQRYVQNSLHACARACVRVRAHTHTHRCTSIYFGVTFVYTLSLSSYGNKNYVIPEYFVILYMTENKMHCSELNHQFQRYIIQYLEYTAVLPLC